MYASAYEYVLCSIGFTCSRCLFLTLTAAILSLTAAVLLKLDWSKDGQITFKEYLIGMERIIIETAGDEDEDDLADQQVDDLQVSKL